MNSSLSTTSLSSQIQQEPSSTTQETALPKSKSTSALTEMEFLHSWTIGRPESNQILTPGEPLSSPRSEARPSRGLKSPLGPFEEGLEKVLPQRVLRVPTQDLRCLAQALKEYHEVLVAEATRTV